jgi:hypothetical protein
MRGGATRTLTLVLLGTLAGAAGCQPALAPRPITAAELGAAPSAAMTPVRHLLVADAQALRELCSPLGPRLGLLQIRTRAEWSRLAAIAPQIGPCPDLERGTLIGVACWAGRPTDGHWPVRMDGIRAAAGSALVQASFIGGSFLPDGTAFLETAYARTVRNVLAVDVDGTAFYPNR